MLSINNFFTLYSASGARRCGDRQASGLACPSAAIPTTLRAAGTLDCSAHLCSMGFRLMEYSLPQRRSGACSDDKSGREERAAYVQHH